MSITKQQFCDMTDISLVGAYTTIESIDEMIELCNKYKIKAAAFPAHYIDRVKKGFADGGNETTVFLGGCGFPTGFDNTEVRLLQMKEFRDAGCGEFDITNNLCWVKDGRYDLIEEQLRTLVEACNGLPSKVIIEATYLTEDEMRRMCDIVGHVGATFIKTGTGWAKSTTLEQVKLLKSCAKNGLQVKAAGGVSDIATVNAFAEAGATRFGVGLMGVKKILKEYEEAEK